jgi:nicotinate-nucleotide adenylyltransferase
VLYGGAFDPPHLGHVAVADAARKRFDVERLVVLVNERPAHRKVHATAEDRLALARAAFPADDVRLDRHPRTVELLRAESFDDPVFVIGADQFRDFLAWSEPAEVLERTRLAVATRPGFSPGELDEVLESIERVAVVEAGLGGRHAVATPLESAGQRGPERVTFFEIEPNPAASRDIRARLAAGEPLDGLVPDAVARLVEERGLYRP